MLYFPKTRAQLSQEVAVAAGASITAEGCALVAATVAGVMGAQMGSATAGEKFIGVALSDTIALTSMTKTEKFVQGAGNTFTLNKTPTASTLYAYDITAGAVIPPGGGGWSLSNKVVTFQAGTVGHTIMVVYRYAPTVAEAQAIQGDVRPGGAAGALLNQVGVIKSGVVYTTEFDTSVDWMATSPAITLGANGRFTIGGTGAVVNGVVVQAPHADGPDGGFLGIEFAAQ